MDDQKIKDLFSGFDPELSSSTQFITRLRRNMEAVEIVREHNLYQKRHNRIAIVASTIYGFLMGIFLTLIYPAANARIASWLNSMPSFRIEEMTQAYTMVAWVLIAFIGALTVWGVYTLTLNLLPLSRGIPDGKPRGSAGWPGQSVRSPLR